MTGKYPSPPRASSAVSETRDRQAWNFRWSLTRKTRSGREFSAWDGSSLSPAANFDLHGLMQQAVQREDLIDAGTLDFDHVEPPREEKPAPAGEGAFETNSSTPASMDAAITDPQPLHGQKLTRKERKKYEKRLDRNARRESTKQAGFSHHEARPKVQAKLRQTKNAVPSQAVVEESNVASTSFVALPDIVRDYNEYTLDQLVGPSSIFQFKLVPYRKGAAIPIISSDKKQYVLGVFADAPASDDWSDVVKEAADLLNDARARCDIPVEETTHRRGRFATLSGGVSHGQGQTEPKNMSNRRREAEVMKELNLKKPFIRLAGFATAALATWAPKLYNHYVDNLGALHAKHPHLKRNFPSSGSVFAATTYNLGPRTTCYRHTDCLNLPFGWCAITALGQFDYKKGGHIILWEAGLVIEFPPGTTILIPSAVISHSNVPIAATERRFSFTQYTAGGLFRWVSNGFRTSKAYRDSLDDDGKAADDARAAARWKEGLSLWSTMADLKVSK